MDFSQLKNPMEVYVQEMGKKVTELTLDQVMSLLTAHQIGIWSSDEMLCRTQLGMAITTIQQQETARLQHIANISQPITTLRDVPSLTLANSLLVRISEDQEAMINQLVKEKSEMAVKIRISEDQEAMINQLVKEKSEMAVKMTNLEIRALRNKVFEDYLNELLGFDNNQNPDPINAQGGVDGVNDNAMNAGAVQGNPPMDSN